MLHCDLISFDVLLCMYVVWPLPLELLCPCDIMAFPVLCDIRPIWSLCCVSWYLFDIVLSIRSDHSVLYEVYVIWLLRLVLHGIRGIRPPSLELLSVHVMWSLALVLHDIYMCVIWSLAPVLHVHYLIWSLPSEWHCVLVIGSISLELHDIYVICCSTLVVDVLVIWQQNRCCSHVTQKRLTEWYVTCVTVWDVGCGNHLQNDSRWR